MSTRDVVQELLRRIGEGDPERIAELYAERADWKLDLAGAGARPRGDPVDPSSRRRRGRRPTTSA